MSLGDHPHTDPGDGRTECPTCGKWVWLVIHSCKGFPVTAAAMARAGMSGSEMADDARPVITVLAQLTSNITEVGDVEGDTWARDPNRPGWWRSDAHKCGVSSEGLVVMFAPLTPRTGDARALLTDTADRD